MKAINPENPTPLIICGLPKSGTTLIASLLDGHPELMVFPLQSHFVKNIALNKLPAQSMTDFIDQLKLENVLKSTHKIIQLKEIASTLWESSNKTSSDMYQCLYQAYSQLNRPDKAWSKYHYFSEKTTRSEFMLEEYTKKTHHHYKAIYILRDPLDNFSSWRERWKTHNHKTLIIFEYLYNQFLSLYAWHKVSKDKDNFLLITYEELVTQSKKTTKKIAQFLTIEWQESLLIPTKNNQLWSGNSTNHVQFKGISDISIGSYQSRLNPSEIAIFNANKRLIHSKINNRYSVTQSYFSAFLTIHKTLLMSLYNRKTRILEYMHAMKLYFQTIRSLNKSR